MRVSRITQAFPIPFPDTAADATGPSVFPVSADGRRKRVPRHCTAGMIDSATNIVSQTLTCREVVQFGESCENHLDRIGGIRQVAVLGGWNIYSTNTLEQGALISVITGNVFSSTIDERGVENFGDDVPENIWANKYSFPAGIHKGRRYYICTADDASSVAKFVLLTGSDHPNCELNRVIGTDDGTISIQLMAKVGIQRDTLLTIDNRLGYLFRKEIEEEVARKEDDKQGKKKRKKEKGDEEDEDEEDTNKKNKTERVIMAKHTKATKTATDAAIDSNMDIDTLDDTAENDATMGTVSNDDDDDADSDIIFAKQQQGEPKPIVKDNEAAAKAKKKSGNSKKKKGSEEKESMKRGVFKKKSSTKKNKYSAKQDKLT